MASGEAAMRGLSRRGDTSGQPWQVIFPRCLCPRPLSPRQTALFGTPGPVTSLCPPCPGCFYDKLFPNGAWLCYIPPKYLRKAASPPKARKRQRERERETLIHYNHWRWPYYWRADEGEKVGSQATKTRLFARCWWGRGLTLHSAFKQNNI